MFVRLLLASALAVGFASAQRGGGGGGGGGGMDSTTPDTSVSGMSAMGGGAPRARQSRADIVADKLHLNKEQKEKASAIFSAAQEEARPINEQIVQGRNVITSAMIDGKTGDDLTKMMADFTDLMAKKSAVEAKAYAKIYAILEPKQQAKAATVFADNMDGMFDGGGARARGNRGGGQ